MGLYDRDYYREDKPGIRLGGDWSAVTTLIVINVAVAVVGLFFFPANPNTKSNWLTENLGLSGDFFQHPWTAWQLVTYGFVHDPTNIWHLAFNMFGLWMFGTEVETIYGRREFYRLYFSLIILSGLFNLCIESLSEHSRGVVGASGGVVGLSVIFACHFPRRLIYVWGVLPVPAMIFVLVFVALELLATQSRDSQVSHWTHLGGAAFGFLYYKTGWSLFRLWPRSWSLGRLRLPTRRPKFRVHREEEEEEPEPDTYLTTGRLQKRVDELLEKISRSGEASLSEEERQFLAEASRRYQQRRR
jgi:membrane associated rhomboid family serine protease